MTSISPAEMSSRRMFSTRPSGVRPASNKTRVVRSPLPIVTRHENPCSARRASPVRPPSRNRADTSGYADSAIGGRFAGPSSTSSMSVTLSTSVVTVSESTGSSETASIPTPDLDQTGAYSATSIAPWPKRPPVTPIRGNCPPSRARALRAGAARARAARRSRAGRAVDSSRARSERRSRALLPAPARLAP